MCIENVLFEWQFYIIITLQKKKIIIVLFPAKKYQTIIKSRSIF